MLDTIDFHEQERYRDMIRLKFTINKFLQKVNNISYCECNILVYGTV